MDSIEVGSHELTVSNLAWAEMFSNETEVLMCVDYESHKADESACC